MAGQPILPRDLSNPSMTAGIQRTALARIRRHEKTIKAKMRELVDSIPYRRVDAETGMVINSSLPDDHWLYANQTITYQFDLSASVLEQLSDRIDAILWSEYMETESTRPPADWWLYSAVDNAYEQGTAQAVTNLAAISDEYTRTIASVISNPEYADRIAFVRARQFELMRGLTDETRANLADTLARAMQAGENPLAIKREIQRRVGVSASRAERIARTEIATANRRARLAEAQDAEERLGIRTKMMWLSALSPTTRRTHAARHGKLYTRQEVEDFYSRDANSIQCKCSQTEILVDENGNPLDGGKAMERLQERSKKFLRVMPLQ